MKFIIIENIRNFQAKDTQSRKATDPQNTKNPEEHFSPGSFVRLTAVQLFFDSIRFN